MSSLNTIFNNYSLSLTLPIIIMIVIILAWMRVGTIISLLHRIWRLVVGKVDANDQKLIKFNKDMSDIEQFNFVYGLKVKSIKQMHQIIDWIEKYELGYVNIWYAKKWLDLSSLEIKTPANNYLNWRIGGAVISVVLLAFSSYTINSKSALLQFKESKTWFYLKQKQAEGFASDWVIDINQCAAKEENKAWVTNITQNERDELCKLFNDKSLSDYLEKTIHFQKILISLILLGSLIWLMIMMFQMESYQRAKSIQKILNYAAE